MDEWIFLRSALISRCVIFLQWLRACSSPSCKFRFFWLLKLQGGDENKCLPASFWSLMSGPFYVSCLSKLAAITAEFSANLHHILCCCFGSESTSDYRRCFAFFRRGCNFSSVMAYCCLPSHCYLIRLLRMGALLLFRRSSRSRRLEQIALQIYSSVLFEVQGLLISIVLRAWL